jgi:hypothetical protein
LQRRLIILHLTLKTITTRGSPANLVHGFLSAFFRDEDALIFEEVPFDLEGKGDGTHTAYMKTLAKQFQK